jgi:glutamyl-tRNA synthetase
MAQQAQCFFGTEVQFDETAAAKFLTRDIGEIFETLFAALEACHDWKEEVLDEVFKGVLQATGLKFGKLAQPARVALTGSTNGPSICVIMEILGREKTLARLQGAVARLCD